MSGVEELPGGGAPQGGEPAVVELLSTRFVARGTPRDGIDTVGHLGAWLRDHRDGVATPLTDRDLLGLTDADVERFVALRDAVHGVATAVVHDRPAAAAHLDGVNAASASVPCWPELVTREGGGLGTVERADGVEVDALVVVRAELARAAVSLVGGPDRHRLAQCAREGCVLFFLRAGTRRAWCSPTCGNRARVARHYQRHKAGA